MDLLLDILQVLGVAAAVGLRPWLAAIGVGLLALGDLGTDFDGTTLAFLESPIWIAALAVGLLGSAVVRTEQVELAVAGLAIVIAALLGGAQLDDRHDVWWYGLPLGAMAATAGVLVARELLGRVRARFDKAGDRGAAAALPVYAEIAALGGALAAVAFPPLGLAVAGFVAALLVQQRKRSGEKYAGLRILR